MGATTSDVDAAVSETGAHRPTRYRHRLGAVAVGVALVGGSLMAAAPASAAVAPIVGPLADSVTADVLPTAQIDGVGWTQLVVGNTVYVGGEFTKARPAGEAENSPLAVGRANLLSYDIRTGKLTSWAPAVVGAVRDLALSPDGARLYVAGGFSSVDGQPRSRLAAFDLASGRLVANFAPPFDYTINSIAAIGSSVYAGGAFKHVGSATRQNLAAVRAADGALTAWAPRADGEVSSLLRAPRNGPLVVGGTFGTLAADAHTSAVTARGLGALDVRTGAVVTWAANQRVQNWGGKAGVTSLSEDGTRVYGTAYNYAGTGNLEGTFATDAKGNLVWVEDCHGDTYDSYPMGALVYTVGHAHDCARIGGFPNQPAGVSQRALAFTTAVRGTLATNTVAGYADWGGTPSPALTTWFPYLAAGSYTGATQAAWSVTGNGTYVVLAGEFPRVGNSAQQGLVRFALRTTAPAKVGPAYVDTPPFSLTASKGAVRMDFGAAADVDDLRLTYTIYRDDVSVGTLTRSSTFWQRPDLVFNDKRVPAGSHAYKLRTADPEGNPAWFGPVSVTVPAA